MSEAQSKCSICGADDGPQVCICYRDFAAYELREARAEVLALSGSPEALNAYLPAGWTYKFAPVGERWLKHAQGHMLSASRRTARVGFGWSSTVTDKAVMCGGPLSAMRAADEFLKTLEEPSGNS